MCPRRTGFPTLPKSTSIDRYLKKQSKEKVIKWNISKSFIISLKQIARKKKYLNLTHPDSKSKPSKKIKRRNDGKLFVRRNLFPTDSYMFSQHEDEMLALTEIYVQETRRITCKWKKEKNC
jgi:hypothetical protein